MILVLFILLISLTSAAYQCTEGELISEREEIDIAKSRLINGIRIGLIDSDEVLVYNRIVANILIDSKHLDLSNSSELSQIIEISSKEYNITLISATNTKAKISVEGSSENLEEGDLEKIDGLYVLLDNSDFQESGEISADILVGETKLSLSNDGNPQEIINKTETEYLIELFSASDSNAIIDVSICQDGSFVEVLEELEEESNETEQNETEPDPIIEDQDLEIEPECETPGLIIEEEYCNENQEFVSQKDSGLACTNNYECISNTCKDELCYKAGFFQKIIDWFKGLFS